MRKRFSTRRWKILRDPFPNIISPPEPINHPKIVFRHPPDYKYERELITPIINLTEF